MWWGQSVVIFVFVFVWAVSHPPKTIRSPGATYHHILFTRKNNVKKTPKKYREPKNREVWKNEETIKKIMLLIFYIFSVVKCAAVDREEIESIAPLFQQIMSSFGQAIVVTVISCIFILVCYSLKSRWTSTETYNNLSKRGYSVQNYFFDKIPSKRDSVSKLDNLPLWQVPPLKTHRTNRWRLRYDDPEFESRYSQCFFLNLLTKRRNGATSWKNSHNRNEEKSQNRSDR